MATSALDSIIQWAQNALYDWQSDAVRRILIQGDVTDEDEEEIFLMLKERNGITDPQKPAPKPQPLKKGDISGAPPEKVKIILKAINGLQNVNAIPNGSHLNFAHQGLNVIYGENGTGKSGYARVLKRACMARDTEEKLLQNIFEKKTSEAAKALFKVSINDGQDIEIPWQDGIPEETGVLSNICVFDSKCARIIVNDENEATYLPYGAGVFFPLVNMHKRFRLKLERENPKPEKLDYPDIPATTVAGKMLSILTAQTSLEAIDKFAKWDRSDDSILTQLKSEIIEAQNNDPMKMAQRLRNTKKRFDLIIDSINEIETGLSAEKEMAINETITKLLGAEKALAVASQKDLSAEPLHGVGEKAWQALYNAAKDYSVNFAYPGKEFPVIGEDNLCVLCMQPLKGEDVKDRMLRFKEFMEKSTKTDVEKAEESVAGLSKDLSNLKFPSPDNYKDLFDEFREENAEVIRQIEEYFPTMGERAKELEKALNTKTIKAIPAPKPSPKLKVQEISNRLEAQAKEREKNANTEELKKKITQKDELEARRLFFKRKAPITGYLKKLLLFQKYEKCHSEAEFGSITKKGNRIIKEALTPQLTAALQKEMEGFSAKHLPIYPKATGEEGQTLHKLELDGSVPMKNTSLAEILSEGEQCVVGMAGFLAELELADHQCPIVLDDPVCSLDHKYMGRIAKRLTQEAAKRQVIIFTHDIAFLLELENNSAKFGVPFMAQTVCRLDCVGRCIDGLPWHAMDVKSRLQFLRAELSSFKNLSPANMPEYNKKAAGLYGLLRETWEAFVEENLLFRTIVRHGSEVQTLRLRYITVEDEDYKKIFYGMENCSIWMTGHDKSKALIVDRPSPSEIQADIDELAQYMKKIGARNDELRKKETKCLNQNKPQ